jgi:hypothetical protein
MIKVVLLRHGQSTWHEENRFTGWTDVDLSRRGKEESAGTRVCFDISRSDAPTVSYATVYPLTMVLRILSAQLLVLLLCG